jgi:hypothetical protein
MVKKFQDNVLTKRWLRQFKYDPYMALVLGTRLWVAHNTLQNNTPTSAASNPTQEPIQEPTQPWPIRLRPYVFPDRSLGASNSASNCRKTRPRHRTYHATMQFWTKLSHRPARSKLPSLPPLAHLIQALSESIKQQHNKFTQKIGDTTVNGTEVLSMLSELSLFDAF